MGSYNGVRVSTSAFQLSHQCRGVNLNLHLGLIWGALVCDIFKTFVGRFLHILWPLSQFIDT